MRIGFELFIDRFARINGNLYRNASTVSGLALYGQLAPHRLRTLVHVEEPEMSGWGSLICGKTTSIVAHDEAHPCGRVPQFDGYTFCPAMFHCVRHSFLPDAEQVHLDWPWQAHRAAIKFCIHLQV